jgi:hypothetical protein
MIKRIVVMDFDGTLMDTMTPETGKTIWKEKTGADWPYAGWWGRRESLDVEKFGCKAIDKVHNAYWEEVHKEDTLMVMMTGRIPRLKSLVQAMLEQHDLIFDEYHYCTHHSTIDFKINKLNEFLNTHQEVEYIEIWEDRPEHTEVFETWCATVPIEAKVHQV